MKCCRYNRLYYRILNHAQLYIIIVYIIFWISHPFSQKLGHEYDRSNK